MRRFLQQFASLVVLLLLAASVIEIMVGEVPEALAILAIVTINALLGIIQEGRAERALRALRAITAPAATVRRGGETVVVAERDLVPGDIVAFEAGAFVPADLRLLESNNLQIDEASLTGESNAVTKDAGATVPPSASLGDRLNMAYKGSVVMNGRGLGVVVATGMQTEIGHIARLIQSLPVTATPLQHRLEQVGRTLAYAALAICAVVFMLALYRDLGEVLQAATGDGFRERVSSALASDAHRARIGVITLNAFLTSVALAIAAVPEGLPAVVTINLALGMRDMARRHALVRQLHAVETLGNVSVICTDKTGTLTQNEMTVVQLHTPDLHLDVTGAGYLPEGEFLHRGTPVAIQEAPSAELLLTAALLSSDASLHEESGSSEVSAQTYRVLGDPTEGALVVAAAKAGLYRDDVEAMQPRTHEIPFDADRKRMSTLHAPTERSNFLLFVKGAPDSILERCTNVLSGGAATALTPAYREHLANLNRTLAHQIFRVLAVAYREFDSTPAMDDADAIERELTLIGLIAIKDVPRPEVKSALAEARAAGMRTVMITGDYPATAEAIGHEVGLLTAPAIVVSGAELETMSEEELAARVETVDIFARVSPTHKLRIVDALHRRGHVVAMTGDGVNDAPALKAADIGVAMGKSGSDVARETADIVLTDNNYASIVSAVEQGRRIYDNIRRVVYFLLSCNLAEIVVILIPVLLGYPIPLTALQILWLNLLTDGAPAVALGVEKAAPDVMLRPPRPPRQPIIDRTMLLGVGVQSAAIAAAALTAFVVALNRGDVAAARNCAFITLAVSELLRAHTARSENHLVWKIGILSNSALQYATGLSLVLLLAVVYWPPLQSIFGTASPSWNDWLITLPLAALPALIAECLKLWRSRHCGSASRRPSAPVAPQPGLARPL